MKFIHRQNHIRFTQVIIISDGVIDQGGRTIGASCKFDIHQHIFSAGKISSLIKVLERQGARNLWNRTRTCRHQAANVSRVLVQPAHDMVPLQALCNTTILKIFRFWCVILILHFYFQVRIIDSFDKFVRNSQVNHICVMLREI